MTLDDSEAPAAPKRSHAAHTRIRIDAMGIESRWWYALKPASWPKLLVPAALGQAVGAAVGGSVSVGGLVFGVAWMIADTAFIVLLNDWGDREVDAIKRRMFPRGCSPKTIPDGILSADLVLRGGVFAGFVAFLVALAAANALMRPLLLPLCILGLLVFVAYSLPPIRLNYRGGGEALEALGVGAVLPCIHAYAQGGTLAPSWLLALLPGSVSLALASALASGLSDEESDRVGGKHTVATHFGNASTRRATEALLVAGASLWILAGYFEAGPPMVAVAPAAVLTLVFGARVRERSAASVENAFEAQARYKGELHRAIWWGTLLLAFGVLVSGLALGGVGEPVP